MQAKRKQTVLRWNALKDVIKMDNKKIILCTLILPAFVGCGVAQDNKKNKPMKPKMIVGAQSYKELKKAITK